MGYSQENLYVNTGNKRVSFLCKTYFEVLNNFGYDIRHTFHHCQICMVPGRACASFDTP